MTTSWSLSALLRESVKLSLGSWVRTVFLMLFGGGVVVGASFSAAQEVNSIVERDLAALQQGSQVFVIEAAAGSDVGPDAAACERLVEEDSVVGAGSVVSSQLEQLQDFPGMRISHQRVTRGYLSVAFYDYAQPATQETVTAAAGNQVSESFGLGTGSTVRLSGSEPIAIDRVLAAKGRIDDTTRSIIEVVSPAGESLKCVTEIAPKASEVLGDSSLLALGDFGDGQFQVSSLVRPNDFGPSEQYSSRTTKNIGWLGALAIVVLLEALRFSRRSESGLYRALGTTRVQLAVIHTAEYLLVALGAVIVSSVAVAIAARSQHWSASATTHGIAALLIALIAPAVLRLPLLVLGFRQNTVDALKDR